MTHNAAAIRELRAKIAINLRLAAHNIDNPASMLLTDVYIEQAQSFMKHLWKLIKEEAAEESKRGKKR